MVYLSQTESPFLILLILLLQNQVYRHRHKGVCIIAQLTTLYCYSAANSKQIYQMCSYSTHSLRGGITPIVYSILTLIPSTLFCRKALFDPFR